MNYSSRVALLGGVIDYAGTFPPAALSLPEALKRAATFRQEGRHPWLMGRIALPVSDIKKLTAKWLYDSGADGSPWIFTALGSAPAGPAATDLIRAVEWDLRELRHYAARVGEGSLRLIIAGYELKLPPSSDREVIREFIRPLLDRFAALGPGTTPYFEVSLEADWRLRLESVADTMSHWCENAPEGMVPGIKIRTGGQTVPAPEQVAQVITACVSRGLRFKATQGLHEAMTHGASLGFVNLFGALSFAAAFGEEKFGNQTIADCLKAGSAKEFTLAGDEFAWKEFRLTSDEVEAARRRHAATFGSCSVDEPDESLAKTFPEKK